MHTNQLGMAGSFLLALLAAGCSDDKPSGTVDSGTTQDTGSPVDDGGEEDAPPLVGDMRPCTGSTIATGSFPLSFQGTDFSYLVHVPPTYDGTKRTPLVVNWHGLGSRASEEQILSQYDPLADQEGFIVVYPNSPDGGWRAGLCCTPDGGVPRDDVAFARALVETVSKAACIDSKRVYSTGLSNGAFMTHSLACQAADLFAAVVPVAGKMLLESCTPSRPIPIMHFHGTADMTVPYDATYSPEGVDVPGMMQKWATRNGCKSGPSVSFQMGNATCQTWSRCTAHATVTLCTEEGDGHCWPGTIFCPGGMQFSKDISATRDGWNFMKQFGLP